MDKQLLLNALREKLPPKRLEHSLNVASSAAQLAHHYRTDEAKAYYAGLAHDICKCTDADEMTQILQQSGYIFLDCEQGSTNLLHGPAGAEFLRQSGLCDDEEILNAVRYHSTGRAGMNLLEKIVFIADLISAERDYPDVDIVRKLAFKDLNKTMYYILQYIVDDLTRKGMPVHPNSIKCLEKLNVHL